VVGRRTGLLPIVALSGTSFSGTSFSGTSFSGTSFTCSRGRGPPRARYLG